MLPLGGSIAVMVTCARARGPTRSFCSSEGAGPPGHAAVRSGSTRWRGGPRVDGGGPNGGAGAQAFAMAA